MVSEENLQNRQGRIRRMRSISDDDGDKLQQITTISLLDECAPKLEVIGNPLLHRPDKIVAVTTDIFGEVLYLLTYHSSESEVYMPTWVYSWLLEES